MQASTPQPGDTGVADDQRAYEPVTLNKLQLRNRVIKTATYEGMCPGGWPSDALTEHHTRLARGGVGMTTVAYCAVSPRGKTFSEQMAMSDDLIPRLRELTDSVHAEGGAVSIQLGHCGGFSKNTKIEKPHPRGPSRQINTYGLMKGLFFVHEMDENDIENVIDDFARSARQAKEAGFDAVELHLGHGYLLSQWLSPATNNRRDRWGGSLENRLRLPLAVVRGVREAVGPDFPIITKNNVDDGFSGGLTVDESIMIAKALEDTGVDAIELSGGFVSKTPFYLLRGGRPLKGMIEVEENWLQKAALAMAGPFVVRKYPFEEMFFLDSAKRIREAVDIPLILLGGIVSRANIARAMQEGFDFVAMGRALIANPDLINQFQAGTKERSDCIHCNECMVEMDRGGVSCVLHHLQKH
jgi:2,4-dienoyl-CoA reductase-like NADH-dependent reductase (Old Yellow Enzyme family)